MPQIDEGLADVPKHRVKQRDCTATCQGKKNKRERDGTAPRINPSLDKTDQCTS